MSLESFNFIDSLNASNPTTTDNVSEGDDHIRGIKSTLKTTFPNINGAVTATDEELNYTDGVTSNIQTQIDTHTTNISSKLPLAGGTMTGDVSLGDNVKAKFGDSDDLQIYHDGSNSYVKDAGIGNLILAGNNVQIMNADASQNYITGTNGGAVGLHYGGGAAKLATTSTGIDVTGSVIASGDLQLGSDSVASNINVVGDVAVINVDSNSNGGAAANISLKSKGVNIAKFSNGGDISFYEDTGTTPKFYWDASAESLGIGTTTPDGIFEATGGRSYIRGSNENFSLGVGRGGQTSNYFLGATAGGSPDLLFSNNAGTTNVTFTSGGNVGIGTTSPTLGKLEVMAVEGTSGGISLSHSSGYGNLVNIYRSASDGHITLSTGNNPTIVRTHIGTLDATYFGGNVGIGTSTPSQKLEVAGVALVTSTNANATSSYFRQYSPGFTSGSQSKYGLQIHSGASALIKFGHFTDVGGNPGTIIAGNNTSLGVVVMANSGGVRLANNGTSWSSYSDSRLKNVAGNIDSSLAKVKAMNGVYYTLKDDTAIEPTKRVGVIAQDIKAVLPEAVDDDSDFMQVRYTDIIPVLIEAVKELSAKNDALEARLIALENA